MTIQIRRVYPLIRLTTALALMTLGCSAMYAGVMVLEPLALELGTGRGNSSLIYGTFMIYSHWVVYSWAGWLIVWAS